MLLSETDIDNLLLLARRTLWIAFCWNDHNFGDDVTYAKSDTDRTGITSVDEAISWLKKMEDLLKAFSIGTDND